MDFFGRRRRERVVEGVKSCLVFFLIAEGVKESLKHNVQSIETANKHANRNTLKPGLEQNRMITDIKQNTLTHEKRN